MKRLGKYGVGALIIGIVFVVAGCIWIIWPLEMALLQPANDHSGFPTPSGASNFSSRTAGIIALIFGTGILTAVFIRPKP